MKSEKSFFTGMLLLISGLLVFFVYRFYPQIISTDIANWGQFGDFFGGTLNPIIGLVTAYFAYQAYLNTKKQLIAVENDVKVAAIQNTIDNYGKDLELLINGLIFKTQSDKVYEGASALKHYRDFMGDKVDNISQPVGTRFRIDPTQVFNDPIYYSTYIEISRFRHLVEYYQRLLSTIGVDEKTREYFLEKIRLTLPLTIISCLGSMNFINNKANNHQDGLDDWLTNIHLFKYHERHKTA